METGQTRRRSDSEQLRRQWAILRILSSSGRSFAVKELAEQLNASKPTIQRDLETLAGTFALVEEKVGAQKKLWRLDDTVRELETVQFSLLELLAVRAAMSSVSEFAAAPFASELRSLMLKLRGALSTRHNGALDAMARVFLPHHRDFVEYEKLVPVIDDLVDAIAKRKKCRVVYESRWKKTRRDHTVSPHRLLWHDGALYCYVTIDGVDDITTLAVHRLREVDILSDNAVAPCLDLDVHARSAFGIFVSKSLEEVVIVVDADAAWRFEERTFHPDEVKERLEDGRLRYSLMTGAKQEILPWVLSFAGKAELLKPASWRAELAAAVAALAAAHRA